MAIKTKSFYVRTVATPSTKRGEQISLSAIGLACPLCRQAWLVQIITAGKRAYCESCRIEALSVKVSYRDPKAARRRPAVTNRKGYKIAS